MASSTPKPAAAGAAAAPVVAAAEPSTSQLLKMLVGSLSRLAHPSIASDVLKAAAAEAGIDLKEFALAPAMSAAAARGKGKKKKEGPKAPRAMQPYTIFVTKVMDRMREDPEYRKPDGQDGKPVHAMTVAGHLWKQLKDETREAFIKVYQVLCDQLTSEREVSGAKLEGLAAKIHAFEATIDTETRNKLKPVLPVNLALVNSSSAAAPALPLGVVHDPVAHDDDDDDEDDEDEDDDEDDEDEAEVDAALAKRIAEEKIAAEKRLQAEKEEQQRMAKKQRRIEHAAAKKQQEEQAAKKLQEELAAKKQREEGLAAAAKTTPVAPASAGKDGKSRKKHKAQEGDQTGSAKKVKNEKT